MVYGVVLLMAGIAYFVLCRVLIARHDADSPLAVALGPDRKGMVSVSLYLLAVVLSFVDSRLSLALYVLVALMWIKPDRRIERALTD